MDTARLGGKGHTIRAIFLLAALGISVGVLAAGEGPVARAVSCADPPCPGTVPLLVGPVLTDDHGVTGLPTAGPEPDDRALPINLATALRLAGARPLVIAAAQTGVEAAAAEVARARALWLPSVYSGVGYYRHDGATQGQSGTFYINSKDQFMAGVGLGARFAPADALFAPLAARQILRARQLDVQAARNEALLAVADAYFAVQAARGEVAGSQDVVEKSRALLEKIRQIAAGKAFDPTDVHRAQAQLANFEEAVASSRERWRRASADLTQALRLDPAALVLPQEPPFLRVTLIPPREPVDDLIPVGLTNRPELASQQALVQAALARIRQERIRPLVPSLILEGGGGSPAAPGSDLQYGVFASGAHGAGNPTSAREDVSVGLVWGLENLGFGNRARVRGRQAEQQALLVELFRLQDQVAADVARAHASLTSAARRAEIAIASLKESQAAYEGSFQEMGTTTEVAGIKILTRRGFEVVDALRTLLNAYTNFFNSVNEYNRAQFRLYWALGYPAQVLECERPTGPVQPVDTSRPPQMAPVCPQDPCPADR